MEPNGCQRCYYRAGLNEPESRYNCHFLSRCSYSNQCSLLSPKGVSLGEIKKQKILNQFLVLGLTSKFWIFCCGEMIQPLPSKTFSIARPSHWSDVCDVIFRDNSVKPNLVTMKPEDKDRKKLNLYRYTYPTSERVPAIFSNNFITRHRKPNDLSLTSFPVTSESYNHSRIPAQPTSSMMRAAIYHSFQLRTVMFRRD